MKKANVGGRGARSVGGRGLPPGTRFVVMTPDVGSYVYPAAVWGVRALDGEWWENAEDRKHGEAVEVLGPPDIAARWWRITMWFGQAVEVPGPARLLGVERTRMVQVEDPETNEMVDKEETYLDTSAVDEERDRLILAAAEMAGQPREEEDGGGTWPVVLDQLKRTAEIRIQHTEEMLARIAALPDGELTVNFSDSTVSGPQRSAMQTPADIQTRVVWKHGGGEGTPA